MSRVPPVASSVRTARRKTVGLAFTGAMLVILLATGVAQAVPVTVGFRDFAYDPGQASRATSDTQQSKLWFAGGIWYGGFYSTADESFNIWRLDSAAHDLGGHAASSSTRATGSTPTACSTSHTSSGSSRPRAHAPRSPTAATTASRSAGTRFNAGNPTRDAGSSSTPASRRRSSAASTTTCRPRRVARRP